MLAARLLFRRGDDLEDNASLEASLHLKRLRLKEGVRHQGETIPEGLRVLVDQLGLLGGTGHRGEGHAVVDQTEPHEDGGAKRTSGSTALPEDRLIRSPVEHIGDEFDHGRRELEGDLTGIFEDPHLLLDQIPDLPVLSLNKLLVRLVLCLRAEQIRKAVRERILVLDPLLYLRIEPLKVGEIGP